MSKDLVLKSKTSKVYKSKKLNNANFCDFNHTDYQVFLTLLSKIGGVDENGKYLQAEKLEREYFLTASEFGRVFNMAPSHCYTTLRKAVNRLMKTDVRIQEPGSDSYCRINVCSKAEYIKNEGKIKVKFTDDIMPYLAQVKEKFMIYNLKEISQFSSIYSTRLYELLQEFKETGWMLKSLDQLREAFAVGEKYKHYGHFKSKTFGPACDEINNNYDMSISFEEIKDGRKVVAINFTFKPTIVHEVTNQHTGKTKNFYEKPQKLEVKKKRNPRKKTTKKKLIKKEKKVGFFTSLFQKFKKR